MPHEWQQFRRTSIIDMRPYEEGEDVTGIEISPIDAANGSPKAGDMIARDPNDEHKGWLISQHYFEHNFKQI